MRNDLIHNGDKKGYDDVVWWSRDYIAKLQGPITEKAKREMVAPRGDLIWRAPVPGFYKINCCAASDSVNNRVGIGVIIRDEFGAVMASCCQKLVANFDDIVADCMAIYKGLVFSKDCGLYPCVLESNKAEAINLLSNDFGNASFGTLISDIAGLRSQRNDLSISAVSGSANRTAKTLANLALIIKEDTFWMEDQPACIRKLLEEEGVA